jgi:hypothetical protein
MLSRVSNFILKATLVFLLPSAAMADVFEYSQNLYGLDAQACRGRALDLARTIATATGGTTKAAYCAPLTHGGFDAKVLTDVATIPEIELAVFGFRVVVYDSPRLPGAANKSYSIISEEATYLRVSDCLAVLPKYEAHFRDQTGLTPISAQCAELAGGSYVPQVDSIGKGRQHLYKTSVDLGSGYSSEASQLDVMNYLSTMGATPTNAARPGTFVQINYFASQEMVLTAYDFGRKNSFLTEAECLRAVSDVQPVLSQHPQLNLVSLRCGRASWTASRGASSMIAIFDLTPSGQTTVGISVYTIDQFQTYGDCVAKLATTPNSYCAADIDYSGKFHGYSLNKME